MKFSSLPRVRLASLPTPLQYLPNLTERLGGPKIWVKRDDLTGLAFGGNKARKLEYLMADAVEKKADYIVTGAGFHSNWCTQTAAAAKKLGMGIRLVKSGPSPGYDGEGWDGNHLLHRLMGAEITVVKPEEFMPTIEAAMKELEKGGHRPYYMPVGGSTALGAAGYLNAMLELSYQMSEQGVRLDYLVHATGSGGTQAGLVMGAKAFNMGVKVFGAAVGWTEKEEQVNKVEEIVLDAKERFGLDFTLRDGDITVYNEYVGGGYGFISEGKAEAVKLLAETEGLCIDPVYTATAMACLIDLVRKGRFKKEDNVVFLHTGGAVALFPYKEPLKAYSLKEKLPWTVPRWSPQHE
ncbi:D-cysteine desulfhydrase family protein [Candidatus Bathyarchaeota archaeon]|nr:D-cysteine desulfhydrase family protein [Candidatus Bathyarchaeota archaeon]